MQKLVVEAHDAHSEAHGVHEPESNNSLDAQDVHCEAEGWPLEQAEQLA